MAAQPGDARLAMAAEPVRWLPVDDREQTPDEGLGLCLSGGGYRAMLFHLGALWRLNEAALLHGADRVSSVSGGSIVAATLALHWNDLDLDEHGVLHGFEERVVQPVRSIARHTIDEAAIAGGLVAPGTIGEHLAAAYRRHLFAGSTLQDLPESPRFIINATNLASGALFRFSRRDAADWRVGRVDAPAIALADAVAASSAFPPFLSPFPLDLSRAAWRTEPGNDLSSAAFRGELTLADGGVYDNLGLETVWKRCTTVLVSDAGGHMAQEARPPHDWPRQSIRVMHVIDNQVRDLRKRQAIAGFVGGQRAGTYWGIRSDVADYGLPDALPCPHEQTMALAEVPTRLAALDDAVQERLINWGYAACDVAVRRWVATALARGSFPYPQRGLA